MLPQCHFDASNLRSARNHLAAFKKRVAFQKRQGSINTSDEFKNMFALIIDNYGMKLVSAHYE